ncbi:MAG: helix-turn-helix transcriptional regulator, partial [Bacteroidales bacterium]|nr:helix-turn-helix transcriptional regulator [Bacteroidales bacterium]
VSSYQEDVILVKIIGKDREGIDLVNDNPIRIDALCITIVSKGSMDITLNHTPLSLEENTVLDVINRHTIQYLNVSEDFIGFQLLISKEFLEDALGKEKPMPISFIISKRNQPLLKLSAVETDMLIGIINNIRKIIDNESNIFQRRLLMNELVNFLLEIGNIVYHKFSHLSMPAKVSSKEEITRKFFKLINDHCKEEHDVSFYANELCISPEYLSRILKSFIGVPTNKIITNALMTEAKILLRIPNVSIQQIADELNFSDQSSFGKFFKRNRGISPLEYRNKKV